MVGHLFGYEAALAIDAQARPLREARAAIEEARRRARAGRRRPRCCAACAPTLAAAAAPVLRRPAQRRLRRPPRGQHRGAAGVAVPLRRSASRRSRPTRSSTARSARPASWSRTSPPRSRRAIEELTRPVDAIKHQAKTVTVGISRSDETLLQVPLVQAVLAAGARPRPAQLHDAAHARRPRPRRRRGPRLHPLRGRGRSPTTGEATGRRRRPGRHRPRPPVAHRADPAPAGHQAPGGRRARRCSSPAAGSDGRTVVIVPEIKDDRATGLTLLHVRFPDRPRRSPPRAACCRATATATRP